MSYHTKRADRKRKVLARYKTWKGCVDCGYKKNPAALEFDHIKEGKTQTVASLMYASWKRIKEEIAKCEIVCANCHAIRTFQRARVAKLANALASEASTSMALVSSSLTTGTK